MVRFGFLVGWMDSLFRLDVVVVGWWFIGFVSALDPDIDSFGFIVPWFCGSLWFFSLVLCVRFLVGFSIRSLVVVGFS